MLQQVTASSNRKFTAFSAILYLIHKFSHLGISDLVIRVGKEPGTFNQNESLVIDLQACLAVKRVYQGKLRSHHQLMVLQVYFSWHQRQPFSPQNRPSSRPQLRHNHIFFLTAA